MARNHEKYDYAELAFLRDSDLYRALQADAAASGQPIGNVALLRLADYYAGRRAEPSTGPLPVLAPVVQVAPEPTEVKARKGPTRRNIPAPPPPPKLPTLSQAVEEEPEDVPDPELNENQARDNIAAFLNTDDGFSL